MSKKLLLDKVTIPGIKAFEVYRREGGYKSVEKAFAEIIQRQYQKDGTEYV